MENYYEAPSNESGITESTENECDNSEELSLDLDLESLMILENHRIDIAEKLINMREKALTQPVQVLLDALIIQRLQLLDIDEK